MASWCSSAYLLFLFFFFQAEDGIRDLIVTGVQTCALPIYFRDQRGLDPGMPCVGGDGTGEGWRRTDTALERGAHVLELRIGEPAADSPGEIGRASCRERV